MTKFAGPFDEDFKTLSDVLGSMADEALKLEPRQTMRKWRSILGEHV